jgi:hypothetical protein
VLSRDDRKKLAIALSGLLMEMAEASSVIEALDLFESLV